MKSVESINGMQMGLFVSHLHDFFFNVILLVFDILEGLGSLADLADAIFGSVGAALAVVY